jgi:alpha-acetolactate decarboxylase
MEPNHLYQYSLLTALMSGVSSHGLPVSIFASKGTHGLGTFTHMNGELLHLDSTVYQLQSTGSARIAPPDSQIPFGVTTNFVPQTTKKISLANKSDIDAELKSFAPHATNLFIIYRLTGRFSHIHARTVSGTTSANQSLSELGKTQHEQSYADISGTVIGFRSPANWQGFAVAGEHLHFIDDDRKVGGHVLEIRGERVQISMAVARHVHVELPGGEDFGEADLRVDDEGIRGVEG